MKILFLDSVHPILNDRLTQNGFECIHLENSTISEIEPLLETAQGIVIRSRFPMNAAFLDKCPKIKFIARSGAGMENIDIPYCEQRGIQLYNSPEGNRNAVGEHALGMLLTLFNHLHTAKAEIKKGIWDREGNRGMEIDGKTIGIIGFGHNGRSFAQKLRGFNCQILAYDKYVTGYASEIVKESTLDEIYQKADVISFHVPQNKETVSYFNSNFLQAMKKPFFLINISRGKVVESKIVVAGLKNKKILGAALDVLDYENATFENTLENVQDDDLIYLLNNLNVLLTPHVAGWTDESYEKLSSVLADKILLEFST